MKHLLFFAFLFIGYSSFAQKMTVSGSVVDTIYKEPVRNALAMAIRTKDSTLLGFQRTDMNGAFAFDFPIDTIRLVIRHPNYGDFNSIIAGSVGNNSFDLSNTPMPDKSTGLDEVVIYANKTPVYYRGDTLVFVADSFKVKENAVVEDLIRKLPGMKVDENGKITSQGKEIGQVLVDGDEFFGSDPTIATKNLAADGVQTVEVYEKDSEDGSDEKIQVLDLKLKEEAKKGYFGKVNLAGGLDKFASGNQGFYEGDVLFNKYNNNQKIAVFALASNTPKSNFNFRDLFKFGLAEGGNWDEDEGTYYTTDDGGVNTSNGIPQTLRAGFSLDQKVWKGGRVRLNYSYADNQIETASESYSQYILTDTTYYTDVTSNKKEHYQKHQIGLKFTQELDSSSRIEIEPKLDLNRTTTNSLSSTNFRSFEDSLVRNTTLDNYSLADGVTLNTSVRYFKDFRKKYRKLTARYNIVGNDNTSDGTLNSYDTQNNDVNFDQKKDSRYNSLSQTGFINYVEPITKKMRLDFDYEFYKNNNDQSRSTFDGVSGVYTDLDTNFSNKFQTDRQQHRMGAALIFENAKARITAGARFRTIAIDNRNLFSDTLIAQSLNNILPRVGIVLKFTQSSRLNIQYNTNSSLPSVNQLQPVRDNSNPNFIQIGNSELRPNYTHTLNMNFNMWKGLSGFYVYAGTYLSHQKDAFSSSTTYDSFGRTLSQTVNVDKADFGSFWAGSGIPIKKVKDMRLDINLNGNFSSTENFINLASNVSKNRGIGTDISLDYDRDSLYLSMGAGINYNSPSNTLSTLSSQPYTSYDFNATIEWTLPGRWFINTDATYTLNTGRTANYNLNYVIWNASVQRSFLKTENLFLGIEAYDILNQNISNNRTVTNNVIVDQKSTVIRRYFMAKLTYKFNNRHVKEEENDMW